MGTYKIDYEPSPGQETIVETARNMVMLANEHQVTVEAVFNDVHLVVKPQDTPEEVVTEYFRMT